MDKATYEVVKKAVKEVEKKDKDGRPVIDLVVFIEKLKALQVI